MMDMFKVKHPDFRRNRARAFTAAILNEIDDLLDSETMAAIHERLFEALHRNGACWTTDKEREELGFEPRDSRGWTMSEKREAKRRELEALLSMPTIFAEQNKTET